MRAPEVQATPAAEDDFAAARRWLSSFTQREPNSLAREDIAFRLTDGFTVAHRLASMRALSLIPRRLLTDDVLRMRLRPRGPGDSDATVAHLAALHGAFAQIPLEMRRAELLGLATKFGTTVGAIAIDRGQHAAIPREAVTAQVLFAEDVHGNSMAAAIARHGLFDVLPSAMSRRSLLEAQTKSGTSIAHIAALAGKLHLAGDEVVSNEMLRATSPSGHTVAHFAARAGCLDTLRSEMITKDLLSLRSKAGASVAQEVMRSKRASQVRPELLAECLADFDTTEAEALLAMVGPRVRSQVESHLAIIEDHRRADKETASDLSALRSPLPRPPAPDGALTLDHVDARGKRPDWAYTTEGQLSLFGGP